jgi:protein Mpv17
LEKVCRRLVPGGGARFLATKVVLDSAVMGSVYVAAFFAFGSVVLEGSGLQGFLQKMKVGGAAACGIWMAFCLQAPPLC